MYDCTSSPALSLLAICTLGHVRRRAETMIEELKVPAPDSQPLHFPTEYAVSRFAQLRTILWKNACVYWRYTGVFTPRFSGAHQLCSFCDMHID